MSLEKRVLIIESDEKVAHELLPLFTDEAYEVELSKSLAEAVSVIKEVQFGCVIVDVDLPETNGHEAIRIIKAVAPDLPIIVTAGRNSKELETKLREQDIYYYYLKSFDRKELQWAVRGALNVCPAGGA